MTDDDYPRLLEVTVREAEALARGEVPTEVRERARKLARMTDSRQRMEAYGYIGWRFDNDDADDDE